MKLLLFDPNIPEFPHYLLVLVPLKLLFNLLPNRFFNGLSTVWSGRPGKQLTHQQHLQKCPVCIFIRCRSGQNIWLSNGSGISCIGLKKGWMEPLTPSYSGLPVWPGNVFLFFFPTMSKRASINAATLKLSTGAKSRQSRWGVGLQVTSGLVHSKREERGALAERNTAQQSFWGKAFK